MSKDTKDLKLNSSNLKNTLWDTLQGVRSGAIPPRDANSIVSAARGITSVVQLEMSISKLTSKKLSKNVTGFLG